MKRRAQRPLIGITCRRMDDKLEAWQSRRQGAIMPMIEAVVRGGGSPLLLPILDDTAVIRDLYERTDGLILVGGGDMDPQFYGQELEDGCHHPDIVEDKEELTLASWAVLDHKPLFGICRGMQVINIALGGTLHQDITTTLVTSINHNESEDMKDRQHLVHELRVEPNARLAKILGTTSLKVNSFHHQALDTVASDLNVVGVAPDGVIEAVEGVTDQYIVGMQSHPEMAAEADPRWQALFDSFVEASAQYVQAHPRAAAAR